ncbi:hypothetical protein ROLI_010620 [Roseobacter fucihabitans]|uniref:Uncharacterized protein n=1 Tax=Roseobacter fucihabitans TaxID=1537242 RepID=A0ABZ2BRA2_9RHOB|nr:hypothetical protein [Roseobacter litoralis]MBC6965522.1 hypothetical protein [Roseobacter litoralis]
MSCQRSSSLKISSVLSKVGAVDGSISVFAQSENSGTIEFEQELFERTKTDLRV